MKNTNLPTASKFTIVRQLCNYIPNHLVPKLARETGVDEQARTYDVRNTAFPSQPARLRAFPLVGERTTADYARPSAGRIRSCCWPSAPPFVRPLDPIGGTLDLSASDGALRRYDRVPRWKGVRLIGRVGQDSPAGSTSRRGRALRATNVAQKWLSENTFEDSTEKGYSDIMPVNIG
jgi:hypothetical protein